MDRTPKFNLQSPDVSSQTTGEDPDPHVLGLSPCEPLLQRERASTGQLPEAETQRRGRQTDEAKTDTSKGKSISAIFISIR